MACDIKIESVTVDDIAHNGEPHQVTIEVSGCPKGVVIVFPELSPAGGVIVDNPDSQQDPATGNWFYTFKGYQTAAIGKLPLPIKCNGSYQIQVFCKSDPTCTDNLNWMAACPTECPKVDRIVVRHPNGSGPFTSTQHSEFVEIYGAECP